MWLIRSFLPLLSDCPAFLAVAPVLRKSQVRTSRHHSNPSIRLVAPVRLLQNHNNLHCTAPLSSISRCILLEQDDARACGKKEQRHSSAPPFLSGSLPSSPLPGGGDPVFTAGALTVSQHSFSPRPLSRTSLPPCNLSTLRSNQMPTVESLVS